MKINNVNARTTRNTARRLKRAIKIMKMLKLKNNRIAGKDRVR